MVVFVLVFAVITVSTLQTSAQTIYACYNKTSGVMRYVTGSGMCKKTETQISWSTAGPQGPTGPVGAIGATGATGPTGPQGPTGEGAPEANSGEVMGTVQCNNTAVPLGGVWVYIPGESFSALTDENGNFLLSYVPAGSFKLNISWPKVEVQKDIQVQSKLTTNLGTIFVTCEGCTGNPDGTPCDDGNPCTTDDKCINGSCVGTPILSGAAPACSPTGDSCLNGACSCGGGAACSATSSTCVSGACQCQVGFTDCNGTCTNLNIDKNNCGACGHMCASGQACVSGKCYSTY